MLDENILFNGKGLFVFSDPGGALPILSLIELRKKKFKKFKVISNRKYSFFSDYSFDVEQFKSNPKKIFKSFNPDFVFTGTSYTSNIESEFIKLAKDLNIRTYSYLDHSMLIKKRFQIDNNYFFPELIFVPTIEIKNHALKELINFTNVEILKNPYLNILSNWKPNISKNSFFKNENIHFKTNSKVILIAPDPVTNLGNANNFGFDEGQGLSEISLIIDNLENNITYLLKPHPNQDLKIINKNISNKIQVLRPEINIKNLIYYSDIVVSFFSNILVEASALKKVTVRYHPIGMKNDPFIHKNLGLIANKSSLSSIFSNKF
jgi:CDP-glycerol glycerophosphotransferase (TagB/SpsB family)